jgi:hypothetical protein
MSAWTDDLKGLTPQKRLVRMWLEARACGDEADVTIERAVELASLWDTQVARRLLTEPEADTLARERAIADEARELARSRHCSVTDFRVGRHA